MLVDFVYLNPEARKEFDSIKMYGSIKNNNFIIIINYPNCNYLTYNKSDDKITTIIYDYKLMKQNKLKLHNEISLYHVNNLRYPNCEYIDNIKDINIIYNYQYMKQNKQKIHNELSLYFAQIKYIYKLS